MRFRYPQGERPLNAQRVLRPIGRLYLRDVLTRLPQMTTRDDLDALTPANWEPASV